MPFFGSRNTSASRWHFDLPNGGFPSNFLRLKPLRVTSPTTSTSLLPPFVFGEYFDLPETDQQEGMAKACYVRTPVARENFRPREPVQMQQHGLAV